MQLPVSVWSGYFNKLSPREMIDAFLEGGFTHTEWSKEHGQMLMDSGEAPREIRRYADDHGFTMPQGHLPFKDGLIDGDTTDVLKRYLDQYYELGVRAAVLHVNGGADLPEEETFGRKVEAVGELVNHIRGTDMVICLENLYSEKSTRTPQLLRKYIDAAGGEHLGICLDVGHVHRVNGTCGLNQTYAEFIEGAGEYLKALHIHDNGGQGDNHLLPFGIRKGVDWKEFMTALRKSGYTGLFNLEIPGESGRVPLTVRKEKLKFARWMCDYLLSEEMFE